MKQQRVARGFVPERDLSVGSQAADTITRAKSARKKLRQEMTAHQALK